MIHQITRFDKIIITKDLQTIDVRKGKITNDYAVNDYVEYLQADTGERYLGRISKVDKFGIFSKLHITELHKI